MTKETKKMVKTAAFAEFREGGVSMLNSRPADIELVVGEIRTAKQELDNAAALAKANAPSA